jgi:hypothetical protein
MEMPSARAEFLIEILSMYRQLETLKATVIVCGAAVQQVEEITENFDPYSIHGTRARSNKLIRQYFHTSAYALQVCINFIR